MSVTSHAAWVHRYLAAATAGVTVVPSSRPSTQPNVLVVMYDQIAASALRCYGNPTTLTPNIDRLAAEGVVFDNAYCNSPLCTPARYCLMTGQLQIGRAHV